MAKKIADLMPDLKRIVTTAAQYTSLEIINALAQKGPAYSGKFSSGWYALPPGQTPGSPRQGGNGRGSLYTYNIGDVPLRPYTETFVYYNISNSASYASVALDLEEGRFFKPSFDPVKPAGTEGVTTGERTGNYRYDVEDGQGTSISTAPEDWYVNYVDGGQMQQSITKGVIMAFRHVRA